jgi:hypothetical protein
MSQIGWAAGLLGLAAGAVIGNQFRPLPAKWGRMAPQPKRLELAKTLAVGTTFGLVGAGIGYALTGCDCCPSTGGVGTGTPLTVNVTTPGAPLPGVDQLPQGTPQ